MKVSLATVLVAASVLSSAGALAVGMKMVGGAAMYPSKTIVENASKAGVGARNQTGAAPRRPHGRGRGPGTPLRASP